MANHKKVRRIFAIQYMQLIVEYWHSQRRKRIIRANKRIWISNRPMPDGLATGQFDARKLTAGNVQAMRVLYRNEGYGTTQS